MYSFIRLVHLFRGRNSRKWIRYVSNNQDDVVTFATVDYDLSGQDLKSLRQISEQQGMNLEVIKETPRTTKLIFRREGSDLEKLNLLYQEAEGPLKEALPALLEAAISEADLIIMNQIPGTFFPGLLPHNATQLAWALNNDNSLIFIAVVPEKQPNLKVGDIYKIIWYPEAQVYSPAYTSQTLILKELAWPIRFLRDPRTTTETIIKMGFSYEEDATDTFSARNPYHLKTLRHYFPAVFPKHHENKYCFLELEPGETFQFPEQHYSNEPYYEEIYVKTENEDARVYRTTDERRSNQVIPVKKYTEIIFLEPEEEPK